MSLPIVYRATVVLQGGLEISIDLEEKGWASKPEMADAVRFTLHPKEGYENLPTVSVDLSPLTSGEKKRFVYFSRVLGKIGVNGEGSLLPLARLYCVGWQATVEGRNVRSLLWIYPSGAIVVADEPPFVDELIDALGSAHQLANG